MLDSWKIITLFVFAKTDLLKSKPGGIGVSASTAYCEANSYVQDFLIYLTNTAWGGKKRAKGGHLRDT